MRIVRNVRNVLCFREYERQAKKYFDNIGDALAERRVRSEKSVHAEKRRNIRTL
jgi:hypothetical protein